VCCEQAFERLLDYCRRVNWAGYDPYDGLSSPLARLAPGKLARIALTQLVKRSPLNLRPLLGIKKELNPKGVALFARAILLLADYYRDQVQLRDRLQADLQFLMGALDALRSCGYGEACWGYNFDWQSRAFFAPRNTPNVVCTAFAANAYLDWYERTEDEQLLDIARSSCRFLLDRINRTVAGAAHCFSYTPLDKSCIHNVNMLAAELLARVFSIECRDELKEAAEGAVHYTLMKQRRDGSWPYGEAKSQQWIDSFHTGFVLVSLKRIIKYLGADEWKENLLRGYYFYRENFFLADSSPKYYHNKLFPLDVHSAAQAIITFLEMADLVSDARERASQMLRWTIDNMQDASGYFYYQRHRFYAIKTAHIRWAQAWMLYALSLYLSRMAYRNG
jgi:hypothetical protein